MSDYRKYGQPPFRTAVIHGGPGAAGEMATVAREISSGFGVLEPMQEADSIQGQIEELRQVLEANAELPVVLIGFSWGAWLGCLAAAQTPCLAKKLILIGSGPFEEKFAETIRSTRMNRLSDQERAEVESMMQQMDDPIHCDEKKIFARFGALFEWADAFDPIQTQPEEIIYRPDIYRSVWPEAAALRRSGKLLKQVSNIRCPVVAIHGDYDPHPAEGVREPLSSVLYDFRFILLENCGHEPWIERQAREKFYQILKEEVVI